MRTDVISNFCLLLELLIMNANSHFDTLKYPLYHVYNLVYLRRSLFEQ